MAELPMTTDRRRLSRREVAESGNLRVIRLVHMRRMHLLLAMVFAIQAIDLMLSLWNLSHG